MLSFLSEKIYDSLDKKDSILPHIDHKAKILIVIQLENRKILGAFSNTGFDSSELGPVVDRDAMIFDISNKKYFINFSGKNAIENHPAKLVWGIN